MGEIGRRRVARFARNRNDGICVERYVPARDHAWDFVKESNGIMFRPDMPFV